MHTYEINYVRNLQHFYKNSTFNEFPAIQSLLVQLSLSVGLYPELWQGEVGPETQSLFCGECVSCGCVLTWPSISAIHCLLSPTGCHTSTPEGSTCTASKVQCTCTGIYMYMHMYSIYMYTYIVYTCTCIHVYIHV